MVDSLLLTLVGPDRPGLVERVAGVVAAHEGNWLESRLAQLGGHFAGVVRVEVPAERREALGEALGALSAEGLTVSTTAVRPGRPLERRTVRLEVMGHDRPRIVSEIAAVVARHGLNVEEFHSEVISAPMSGEPLFTARLRLVAPAEANLVALRGDLETLAGELMVDVALGDQPGT